MNNLLFFLTAVILFAVTALTSSTIAVAQSSYNVIIPDGAANSYAPFFWQNEFDGSTTGIVEILPGDTITWKNVDSAVHTVTSGTASDGYDGMFDSGLFGPGKSFSYTFEQSGVYPYYCLPHPWMEGTVFVVAAVDDGDAADIFNSYSVIQDVGKQAGDGSAFFDVEYDFDRIIILSAIREEEKSITFEITDNYNINSNSDNNDSSNNSNNNSIKPLNHDLTLRFPSALIDGDFVIFVDGDRLLDYDQRYDGTHHTLHIVLSADSEFLTIMGTSIVPEFGSSAILILVGASLATMVILSPRLKLRLHY